jgi:hypothetical protein
MKKLLQSADLWQGARLLEDVLILGDWLDEPDAVMTGDAP